MKSYFYPIDVTKHQLTGGAVVRNSRIIEKVKLVIFADESKKVLKSKPSKRWNDLQAKSHLLKRLLGFNN